MLSIVQEGAPTYVYDDSALPPLIQFLSQTQFILVIR